MTINNHMQIKKNTIEDVLLDGGFKINIIEIEVKDSKA